MMMYLIECNTFSGTGNWVNQHIEIELCAAVAAAVAAPLISIYFFILFLILMDAKLAFC